VVALAVVGEVITVIVATTIAIVAASFRASLPGS